MKKITLVTITYNSASDTKKMVSSLEHLSHPNCILSVIIVDNASHDKFTLDSSTENITVIRSEENTGFAGGCNIGMTQALHDGADYVLLLNNDTIVDPKLVSELLKGLEIEPKAGITVPKIYFAKGHEFHKDHYKKEELGRVFWYAGGFTDWSHVFSNHRGVDEVDNGQYDEVTQVDFATGCCMLIKKEVIEKVGMFDERYFLYFEDADFSERTKKAGFAIYYMPKAKLWHVTSASTGGSGSTLHDYFLTRNRLLFGFSYAPLRTKIALLRESIRFLQKGRPSQKQGVKDFFQAKFGKGTFPT